MTQRSQTFVGTHTTWTAPADLAYGYVAAYCQAQQGAQFVFPGQPNQNFGWTGNYVRGNVTGIVPGTTVVTVQAANADFPTPNPGGGGTPGHGCGIAISGSPIMQAQGGVGGNLGNGQSGVGGGTNFAAPGVTNGVVVVGSVYGNATLVAPTQQVILIWFTVDAMLAPTPVAPPNAGFLDTAAGFVLDWTDNPQADSGTQTQVAIRRQDITTSGPFQWFNPATHTWGGSELYFASTASQYTFGVGDWADGDDYSWSVSVAESYNGKKSPYSAAWTLHARQLPTLVITSPSATTNTPTPTVAWTPTFHAGTSMTAYRGLIYLASTVADPNFSPGQVSWIYDTGNVASTTATSFTVPFGILQNSQNYSVFVQINGGGTYSAWTRQDFQVVFTPPPTPTFIWNAQQDPFGSPMWVASGQVLSPTGASGFAAEIQVSEDNGVTWSQLRTQELASTALSLGATSLFMPGFQPTNALITDYESPFNVPLLYRARVWAVEFTQNVPSNWSGNVPITLPSNNYYLVDPVTPGVVDASGLGGVCQLRRIRPQSALTSVGTASLAQTQVEAQGVFYGLGRTDVVVVSGDLYDEEFDISALFFGDAAFQTFKALRARQVPLLLKSDSMSGDQTYVKLGATIPVTMLHAQNRRQAPMRAVSFHCYPVLEPTDPVNPAELTPTNHAGGNGQITFNGAGTATFTGGTYHPTGTGAISFAGSGTGSTTGGGSSPGYGKGTYGEGTYGVGNG